LVFKVSWYKKEVDMKRVSLLVLVTLFLALALVAAVPTSTLAIIVPDEVYVQQQQQQPRITLTPEEGFSAIMISGEGFWGGRVSIYWGDDLQNPIPTVPFDVWVGWSGEQRFGYWTAIIVVPKQTEPGQYRITARDEEGASAQAWFTVVDMTGPEGPEGPAGATGPQGTAGEQGPPGEPGPATGLSIVALILAVIAVGIMAFMALKKLIVG
jgi:hypothetical protein